MKRPRGSGRIFLPKWTTRDPVTGETITHTSTMYRAEISLHGQLHAKSLKTRTEAEKWIKMMAKRADDGPITVQSDKLTLREMETLMKADYVRRGRRSLRRLDIAWRVILHYFDELAAVRATQASGKVDEWIRLRQKGDETYGPAGIATVQRDLRTLARGYKIALKLKKLSASQVPMIESFEIKNARKVYISPEQYALIRPHLKVDVRPLVDFQFITGWRSNEVRELRWDNVDFENGVVTIFTSKNGKGRTYPLSENPDLEALLREQRARTDTIERATGKKIAHVFHHRHGKPIGNYLIGWHGAVRKAGITERLIPHDFRRSAVRRYERSGMTRSVAMSLTGHETQNVYLRYDFSNEKDQRHELRTKLGAMPSLPALPTRGKVISLSSKRRKDTVSEPVSTDTQAVSAQNS